MGSSSSKRKFIWQKKKSPVVKVWSRLKRSQLRKKGKRKSFMSLDKLGLDRVKRQKKRLSLGNLQKTSVSSASRAKDKKVQKEKRSLSLPVNPLMKD